MLRTARRLWSRMFGRYLWVTNTVRCGGLLTLGDGIQQQLQHARCVGTSPNYDWKRTGRLFLVGLSQGPRPHPHVFYVWLDKKFPKRSRKVVFRKAWINQFLGAPVCALMFFPGGGLLEGHTLTESWQEFNKFHWFIWPSTQAINFFLVPAPNREFYIHQYSHGDLRHLSFSHEAQGRFLLILITALRMLAFTPARALQRYQDALFHHVHAQNHPPNVQQQQEI